MSEINIIGGGLAGCEAAWQAAQRGVNVVLYEMRPEVTTGAHTGGLLAELVCSNSLGSRLADRASGVLQHELSQLGSLLLDCALRTAVPAGGALAVDRQEFAAAVTLAMESHPLIRVERQEVQTIPQAATIIASGPLTSPALSQAIAEWAGQEHLFFYDAIAPLVDVETVDFSKAYKASRYDRGDNDEGDYINCPLDQDEYDRFFQALLSAKRIELSEFDRALDEAESAGRRAGAQQFFEGCLPIEILARRGHQVLLFGPMRPAGLKDPRTGRWPYAVVQLRQDNLAGSLANMVGFQTNMKIEEQKRILRMIPGLEQAEFVRFGQMHRNTFIFSPALLNPSLQTRRRADLFFAGQICGVEGYMGNIATGLLAGINAARWLHGRELLVFPQASMLGALCHYISHAAPADFQPMKANLRLLPPIDASIRGKRPRAMAFASRARDAFSEYLETQGMKENTGG